MMTLSARETDEDGATWRIHRPVIVAFVAAFGLMLLFFTFSIHKMRDSMEEDAYRRVQLDVMGSFQTLLEVNAQTMVAILEEVSRDARFLAPYRAGDRQALLAGSQETWERLRRENGITHLYLHGPDGVNFLRVHAPDRFGDTIQSQTLLKSQRSGATAHGLELGSTGALALRVVAPWRDQGRLIGFIDLGMEVSALLKSIRKMLRIDLLVFLEKRYLDRQAWETGMALLERPADWQQFTKIVLAASTLPALPPHLDEHILLGNHKIPLASRLLQPLHNLEHDHLAVDTLADIGGRPVGRIVAIFSDADMEHVTWDYMLLLLAGNLGIALLLGLVFHRLLKAMEERLHHASDNLHHSEQRLRAILDTAMDAIISIDAHGHILEFNQAAEAVFGFRKSDVLGQDISEIIIPPDMRERHRQGLARYLATGEHQVLNRHVELISQDAQGRPIPTEVAITVTPGKEFPFFTAYLRDISQRRQMLAYLEEAISTSEVTNQELRDEVANHKKTLSRLQASEERFRSVTTSIQDAIVAVDQDQRIVFWNQGAQLLFGHLEKEIIGQKVSILVPEKYDEAHQKSFQRCLNQGGHGPLIGQMTELAGVHKDGHEFPLEMSLNTWVTTEGGRFFSAVIRDVTLRRQIEDALREAKEASDKANQAKSIFLANMSHEIRTPMNTIIGMGYLLSQSQLSPDQQNQMQKIQLAAETLLGIIDDILDFSKIEAGRLELEHRSFNLQTVLEKVSGIISLRAEEKGLELLFNTPVNLPTELVGDAFRLEQVLINLGTNAVKFTHTGEVIVSVAQVDTTDARMRLKFSVKDTGIGLSDFQISLLFQAFTQADTSTTRHYGGTGLGLTICKRLVDMMGGDIGVTSTPGVGSVFYFTLPFDRQTRSAPVPAPTLSHDAALRILIVDDNDNARSILENMIREFGFSLTSVSSGELAIAELARAVREDHLPYDMVLLDWRMPGMDGIETARRISEDPLIANSATVIMVTAFDQQEVFHKTQDMGVRRVLRKPVTPSVLFDAIQDFRGVFTPRPQKQQATDDMELTQHRATLKEARILVVEDHDVNWQVAEGILGKANVITERAANGLIAVERLLVDHATFDCLLMDLQMPVMDGYEATRRLREKFTPETLPII
ncbi:MAG: PAS domain S-box protein, partial [Magnetococcales bacterium]|nr:PAS domain S-box protein [Magnetococcales bacterium]